MNVFKRTTAATRNKKRQSLVVCFYIFFILPSTHRDNMCNEYDWLVWCFRNEKLNACIYPHTWMPSTVVVVVVRHYFLCVAVVCVQAIKLNTTMQRGYRIKNCIWNEENDINCKATHLLRINERIEILFARTKVLSPIVPKTISAHTS